MNLASTFALNTTAADAAHHRDALLAEASQRRLVRIARAGRAAARKRPEPPPAAADVSSTRVTRRAA